MKFECEFMKPYETKDGTRHNVCCSLDGLRACIDFDRNGNQIKICESLKLIKEDA